MNANSRTVAESSRTVPARFRGLLGPGPDPDAFSQWTSAPPDDANLGKFLTETMRFLQSKEESYLDECIWEATLETAAYIREYPDRFPNSACGRGLARRCLKHRAGRFRDRGALFVSLDAVTRPIQTLTEPTQRRVDDGQTLELLLKVLPPGDLRMFLAREAEGLPVSEIAEMEGLARQTVSNRLRGARKKLKARAQELEVA